MTKKTKEQIKDELRKGTEEIKRIRRGERSPEWSKIIKEIIQEGENNLNDEKVARPNSNENEVIKGL